MESYVKCRPYEILNFICSEVPIPILHRWNLIQSYLLIVEKQQKNLDRKTISFVKHQFFIDFEDFQQDISEVNFHRGFGLPTWNMYERKQNNINKNLQIKKAQLRFISLSVLIAIYIGLLCDGRRKSLKGRNKCSHWKSF